MNTAFTGLATLHDLLSAAPQLTLKFYDFGIVLHRVTPDGATEHLVDPAQVATALAARVRFDTGLLSPDVLCVQTDGPRTLVAQHRKRQKTSLLIEGSNAPVFVPLPDLVLLRVVAGDERPDYRVFACKGRPTDPDAVLYHAPLPNVYRDGRICWGNVPKASTASLTSNTLDEDFALLLGTTFTNHSVSGKSHSHTDDIRAKYLDMEQRRTRTYPTRDLIPTGHTFAQALEALQ